MGHSRDSASHGNWRPSAGGIKEDCTMQATTQKSSTDRMVWGGRILSGLLLAFMVFDAVLHLVRIAPVVEAFGELGVPLSFAVPLGLVELVTVALYVYPR